VTAGARPILLYHISIKEDDRIATNAVRRQPVETKAFGLSAGINLEVPWGRAWLTLRRQTI
jgi:hypothetical protein